MQPNPVEVLNLDMDSTTLSNRNLTPPICNINKLAKLNHWASLLKTQTQHQQLRVTVDITYFFPSPDMMDERSEVFTAVIMKNGVFWDVMPCGSCTNRCFGGT
jgi:hypothetical protein